MYLVADLFHGFTGKEHPGKPKPPKPSKASFDVKFRLRQARREAELAAHAKKESG